MRIFLHSAEAVLKKLTKFLDAYCFYGHHNVEEASVQPAGIRNVHHGVAAQMAEDVSYRSWGSGYGHFTHGLR